jgi:hypothetical protein
MLIDMDDTILSAYGRPEIAWNNVARNLPPNSAPLSVRNRSPPPSSIPREVLVDGEPHGG